MSPARRGPIAARGGNRRPADRGAVVAPLDDDQVSALEEERDFLLESLRDLEREREASDIDDGDYQTLRDDYTARAAAVLRTLERARSRDAAAGETGESDAEPHVSPAGPATRRGPAAPGPNRTRKALIGVTIVLIVAVAAGVGVSAFSGERVGNENVSGRGMSETARHTTLAQQLETQGKAAEALKEYDAAIAADPSNIVAHTYRGWLLARAGFADRAMESIDKALAINPNYPDAHFFRGMVLYEGRGDPAGAVKEFETYLASNPPPGAADAVRGVLERARNDAANPPPAGAPDEATTTVPG